MAQSLVQEMIEAGVHYGHRASRWNPKMSQYIYARKNLIHIVDIRETVRGLLRASKYLKQVAAQGSLILFVGTKRQAGETVLREADRCGMPYVNDRWLGGTLTNFRTIRSRLGRLEELERIRSSEELALYSKEKNAVREARALGITTVALIDTDCDPDLIDLAIPGNDDGIRSIELIVRHLADAVLAGTGAAAAEQKGDDGASNGQPAQAEAAVEGAAT